MGRARLQDSEIFGFNVQSYLSLYRITDSKGELRHNRNIGYLVFWLVFLFLVSWGGVRLSPLGTSATNWPIAPDPDDRR
jgi:hypothetical protein